MKTTLINNIIIILTYAKTHLTSIQGSVGCELKTFSILNLQEKQRTDFRRLYQGGKEQLGMQTRCHLPFTILHPF